MITYKKFISFLMPWIALALIMNTTRFMMTEVPSYIYMNWNLFLAFLPLLFLYFFEKTKNLYLKGFSFFAWLFFLPNASYIVTDLIHLRDVGPEWLLWFDGMMIFSYALVGILISAYSLILMKRMVFSKNILKQNLSLVVIAFLSSFGIYLGRYVRFNTWDIITQPISLAENILQIITTKYTSPIFVTTLIFFTLFILASVKSLELFFDQKKEA